MGLAASDLDLYSQARISIFLFFSSQFITISIIIIIIFIIIVIIIIITFYYYYFMFYEAFHATVQNIYQNTDSNMSFRFLRICLPKKLSHLLNKCIIQMNS